MAAPKARSDARPIAPRAAAHPAAGRIDPAARQFALLRSFVALEKPRAILSAIVGVGFVALVALVVDRTRPPGLGVAGAFLVAVGGFVGVTYGLATLLRPRPVARAFEVYRWVGRHDWLDWRRRAGRRVPQSQAAARRWLEGELRRPDSAVRDPLPRIEIYLWLGQLDDAQRAARSLPVDRPWDRFERDLMTAFVAWVAGDRLEAAAALDDARASAEQLSGPERRLAAAKVAVEEARRTAFEARSGSGGAAALGVDDAWLQPLVDVRERLGPALDGFLVRDLARWPLPVLVGLGALSALVSFVVAEAG